MKKVLIIGANGYIGARLSYLLANNNYEITAICYPQIPADKKWTLPLKNIEVYDVQNEKSIGRITDKKYDVAIYLVSLDHHQSNVFAPYKVCNINVLPVWNLLSSFSKNGNVNKFIYFSTIHIYGSLSKGKIIKEKHTPNPKTPYALTHLMAEDICNMFNNTSSMDCINIRLSNSYGSPFFKDSNCWWLVVNDLCKNAYENKKIVLQSDGSPLRDFIHYNDIFEAIKIIINNNNKFNTYNLSSGKTYSIYQLAKKVQKVYLNKYSKNIPIELPSGVAPKNTLEKYFIDNSRLKNLGFKLSTTLEQGIEELFNYFENESE